MESKIMIFFLKKKRLDRLRSRFKTAEFKIRKLECTAKETILTKIKRKKNS